MANRFQIGSLTMLINSWYLDQASAVYNIGVWYFRGSSYAGGSQVGMFAVASHQGHNEEPISFRLVLTL